jgi:hypothetical protein
VNELQGADGIHALACDTDGIDGTEDNAGAIAAPDSLARAAKLGLNAGKLLENNDGYSFFSALGDLVVTGPTRTNVNAMVAKVQSWESPHAERAQQFMEEVGPARLFDLLHSTRRWYSGGTRAHNIAEHRDALKEVMKLEPKDALGVYRGFKVDRDNPLAALKQGERLTLDVTRNKGISSWTTTEAAANKFSGAGNGKVGLIIKLVGHDGIEPILAPPTHTEPWFNELYGHVIGKSWRPTEHEYLIRAPKVDVEVVRVKR